MADNDDFIKGKSVIEILRKKLHATPEEIALWAFLGPDNGGIAVYTNDLRLRFVDPSLSHNDLPLYIQPEKAPFSSPYFQHDYLPLLKRYLFRQSEVEQFEPRERYITVAKLIERWRQHDKDPEDSIRMEISQGHLEPIHPIFGGYTEDETSLGNNNLPPLSDYLVPKSCVESIETKLVAKVEEVILRGIKLNSWEEIADFSEEKKISPWRDGIKLDGKIKALQRIDKATGRKFITPGSSGVRVQTDGYQVKCMFAEYKKST